MQNSAQGHDLILGIVLTVLNGFTEAAIYSRGVGVLSV